MRMLKEHLNFILIFLLTSLLLPFHFADAQVNEHRIGTWLQYTFGWQSYTPEEFVDFYFLKPPYFAYLMYVTSHYLRMEYITEGNAHFNWLKSVLSLASTYPNIKISLAVGLDLNNEAHWTILSNFVNTVKQYPAVWSVGLDGEFCTGDWTIANIDRAKAIVEGADLRFVNTIFWIGEPETYNYEYLDLDSWPTGPLPSKESGLDVWNLKPDNSPATIGMMAGQYLSNQRFPYPTSPPSNPFADWAGGWNQEVINLVMDYGVGAVKADWATQSRIFGNYPKPEGTRQVLVYTDGFTDFDFIGVSGKTSRLLSENPLWRQYIWERQQVYSDKIITSITPPLGYQLNLRVKDWDLTDPVEGAYVYMNNGTEHVKVSDSNGWANWTEVSGLVQIKVKYYGFWVNGTFSVYMDSDKTVDIRCKLYDVTVTVKPHNLQGVITTINVTVFNSTSALSNRIRSGITANWTGAVTLKNLPNNTLTFTVYAKSDYSLVIANTTLIVTSDCQTFNIVANQNYGGVGMPWEIIVYVGLILSQPRKIKRKRGLGV